MCTFYQIICSYHQLSKKSFVIAPCFRMLFYFQCNVDDNGDPTDELTPLAVEYCRQRGVIASKVSEIINKKEPAIYKAIQEGIDLINAKASSNAQRVQKWTILPEDFSISGGELGECYFFIEKDIKQNKLFCCQVVLTNSI